jgi:hypothetical protein
MLLLPGDCIVIVVVLFVCSKLLSLLAFSVCKIGDQGTPKVFHLVFFPFPALDKDCDPDGCQNLEDERSYCNVVFLVKVMDSYIQPEYPRKGEPNSLKILEDI